jgi:uncharacterized protein YjbJ (UPF0337 family)
LFLQATEHTNPAEQVGSSLPGVRSASYRLSHAQARPSSRRNARTGRRRETTMNQDRIEGRWKQLKGKVKEQWGKLTDDDLDVIAGRRDQLLGRIQQRHGLAREEADRQVGQWERSSPEHRLDRDTKSR